MSTRWPSIPHKTVPEREGCTPRIQYAGPTWAPRWGARPDPRSGRHKGLRGSRGEAHARPGASPPAEPGEHRSSATMVAEPVHARLRGAGTPRGGAAPDPQPLMLPPTGPTRGLSAGPADGWGGRRGEVGRREGPPGIDPAVTGQHQPRYCVAEPVRALLCGAGDPPEDPAAPLAPHRPGYQGLGWMARMGTAVDSTTGSGCCGSTGRYARPYGLPAGPTSYATNPNPQYQPPLGHQLGARGNQDPTIK